MTQLNTPYPATAYLTGFLRQHEARLGLEVFQADAALELFLRVFSRAGLTPTSTFTTLLDLPAPLNDQARAFLNTHLGRLRDTMSETLDADDRATLDVLLDPGSPDGILHRPDAFLLSATTVFTARRPAH
jgi:hypothetical protein